MLQRFEQRARRIRLFLRRYPALEPVVSRVGLAVWKHRMRRAARHGEAAADPLRALRVDPRSIRWALWRLDLLRDLGLSGQKEMLGLVRGGDWDRALFPLADLGIFEAIRQRFEEDLPWEEIPYFREMKASVDEGRPQFKYRKPEDFARQWRRIEELHESMQKQGFRTQEELGTHRPWDEVVVALDRRGRIAFVNGRHRLALARVLGLEEVPAIAGIRHSRWHRFSGELRAYVAAAGGRSYQPLLHPDLADVPASKEDDRFELILRHLPARRGRLLDIGANKGYFCHRFEAAGFDCVAVERSAREAYFLTGLRDACERRFEVVEGDVSRAIAGGRYEVVLALNVFHHFLKSEEGFAALRGLLPRLETGCLVFEPHLAEDPQMRGAFRNLEPAEFVRFLIEHSGLERSRRIGSAADGRPIFLLQR